MSSVNTMKCIGVFVKSIADLTTFNDSLNLESQTTTDITILSAEYLFLGFMDL